MTFNNPPPEQADGDAEWTMVPDEAYNLHLVHTRSAMTEPVPFFNADDGVLFELYTPENPREAQLLTIGDLERLRASNFDARRRTRIGVHGWNTDGGLTGTFQTGEWPRRRYKIL